MNKVTVIRIIKYEGTESAIRKAIQMSLPLGTKDCNGYAITVVEYLNELSPEIILEDAQVHKLLSDTELLSEMESMDMDGPFTQAMRDAGKI